VPSSVDLSIIIVNWRSVSVLRPCLASIYANAKDFSFEIIVVDNASFDGCAQMIDREFPKVRFIQGEQNVGFAKANNLGFARSNGKNLLFLNPDTEIVGPAITLMLYRIQSIADAGVVSCTLLNSDHSIQTSCVQRFPSIAYQLLDSELLRKLSPRSDLWGTRALFEPKTAPVSVEMVSGACLMIRRNVFEIVGQFDGEYFMYAEDMDLCYQVHRAGWKIYYVGDAVVIHHGGKSTDSKSGNHFPSILMNESMLRFVRNTRGELYARAYQATAGLNAVVRLSLLAMVFVSTFGKYRGRSIRNSLGKWSKVLRWSIGFEDWAKRLAA